MQNGGIVQKKLCVLAILALATLCADDTITVHNKTPDIIYARVYCVPAITGNHVDGGKLYQLPPRSSVEVVRPEKKLHCTRNVAFSFLASDLAEKMPKKAFEKLSSIGIGITSGKRTKYNFFVIKNRFGALKAYNPLTWQPYQLLDDYEQDLLKNSVLIARDKHKQDVALVRIGTDVSAGEQHYVKQRSPKVKKALEDFLGKKLNGSFIPKIALINSGGGERSFISCLGWHLGAYNIGLLDAVMYDIGLSGGSWFLLSWLVSNSSLSDFHQQMASVITKPFYFGSDAKKFFDVTMIRDALGQPITMVNPWGVLIGYRYLSSYTDAWQAGFFSEQAEKLKDGAMPLPIIAAVSGANYDTHEARHRMHWFQWTPYEASAVGNWLGNAHVPMWAFGRKYQDNKSVDNTPEYDISLLMGIGGSAFAPTYVRMYQDIMREAIKKIPTIGSFFNNILCFVADMWLGADTKKFFMKERFSVGKVLNFAKDVPGSTIGKSELRLVDGALAFNIPTPPALERKADVLILCDASYNIASDMPLIEAYAKEYGHAFPKIDMKCIDRQAVTIYMPEKNSAAPLVMYMPAIDPSGKTRTNFPTSKFSYTKEQYNALSAVTEKNMKDSAQIIKEALVNFIHMRNGFDQ